MKFSIIAKVILLISFSKESNDAQSGLTQKDLANNSNQARQNLSLQSPNSEEKVVESHPQSSDLNSLGEYFKSLPSETSEIKSPENLNLENGQAASLFQNSEERTASNQNNNHETLQTSPDMIVRSNDPNLNVKTLQAENPTPRELDASNNEVTGQKIPYKNLETALDNYPILKKVLTALSDEYNLDSYSPNLVYMLKEREDIRVMCAALFKNDNLQSIIEELAGTFAEDFNLEEFLSEIIKDGDLNKFHEEMKSLMQGNLELENQLASNTKSVEAETIFPNQENSPAESQNPKESQLIHIEINKLENSSQGLTTSSGEISNQSEITIKKPEINESEIKNQGLKVVITESVSSINSLLQGDDPRSIDPMKKDEKLLIDSDKNSQLDIRDDLEKKVPIKKNKKPFVNTRNSKHNKNIFEENHDLNRTLNHVMEDGSNVKASDNKPDIPIINDPAGFNHKNHKKMSVYSKTNVPGKQKLNAPEQYEDFKPPKPTNSFYSPKNKIQKDLSVNLNEKLNVNGNSQNKKRKIFNDHNLESLQSAKTHSVVGKPHSAESQYHIRLTFTCNRSKQLINDAFV
jgi:hypothetical protein